MKTEQRTVYITSDGYEFDTEDGARWHERRAPLIAHLEGVNWCDASTPSIAREILSAFVVIPKARADAMFLVLDQASGFVAGFEDDPQQSDIEKLIVDLSAAMDTLRP